MKNLKKKKNRVQDFKYLDLQINHKNKKMISKKVKKRNKKKLLINKNNKI